MIMQHDATKIIYPFFTTTATSSICSNSLRRNYSNWLVGWRARASLPVQVRMRMWVRLRLWVQTNSLGWYLDICCMTCSCDAANIPFHLDTTAHSHRQIVFTRLCARCDRFALSVRLLAKRKKRLLAFGVFHFQWQVLFVLCCWIAG